MKELAHVLYGSQNYGLDGPDSDKDYKVLLCPEFCDFYEQRKVCADDLPLCCDRYHYSAMSIIQFHSLLMKGNPNCVEMLFSTEMILYDSPLHKYLCEARKMYHAGYLAAVWDSFYPAINGIALNSVDRNGINRKTVSRAFYFFHLMQQIVYDDFRMTADTWRNDLTYQQSARRIRFDNSDQDDLLAIVDEVKTGFRAFKSEAHEAALSYCADHPHSVNDLRSAAENLDATMRLIIALSTYREIESKYKHGFDLI